jgi:ketosteroid isomerase-like protein
MDAVEAVEAANAQYYAAFEAKDLDAMSALWEHSDRSICTHPGWATLRGWARVASSYFALFQAPGSMQFVLTNTTPTVQGDAAWVSVDENLLGTQGGVTVAAINVFTRHLDGRWRLVCHHGSVVAQSPEGAPPGA